MSSWKGSSSIGATQPSVWVMVSSFLAGLRSGVDGLVVVLGLGDGDLAGLGSFGHRDPQGEDAAFVVGDDAFGVEGVTQDELAAEHSARAFGSEELVLACQRGSLRADRQDVAFHVEVDRGRVDAG